MRRSLGLPLVGALLAVIGCGSDSGAPHPGGQGGAGAAGGQVVGGTGNAGSPSMAGAGLGGGGSGAAGSSQGGTATAGGSGAPDDCSPPSDMLAPWPGPSEVQALDDPGLFNGNLSGLTYEPGVLWATANIPGSLYRLVPGASGYVPDAANGWTTGKLLHYPSGSDEPDAEGVTLGATAADGLYVVAEHDNQDPSTSRLSVLRYDVGSAAAQLTATHEWDVTAALPAFGANTGLEAITWVSDDYLTEKSFFDEAAGHTYVPDDYPPHGAGVFFVGVEETGQIFGLLLNEDESFELVANFAGPNAGVMGLEHDRDLGQLWAWCDETCGNVASVFDIDTEPGSATLGHFVLLRQLDHPAGLPDSNNEGIALSPESECNNGLKAFFWTDDADASGQSLRQGSIRCGACP